MVKTNLDNQVSYLLDTNIISELVKPEPSISVLAQFERYQQEIAIPSVVWHELRSGWLKMPEGTKKHMIGSFLHEVISALTILPYDTSAARIHAEIRIQTQQTGINIPFVDGQIAAIAIAQGLSLITRNTKDFQSINGLRLQNWFI